MIRQIRPDDARTTIRSLEDFCIVALVKDYGLTPYDAAGRLQRELDYYRNLRLEACSINDVFHRFCISLANRDRLWNLVYGSRHRFDELDVAFGRILADFEPMGVAEKYDEKIDHLLADLLEARRLPPDQTSRQRTHPRSQFRLYSRGILAGAKFFSQFKDGLEFKRSLEKWLTSPEQAARLPRRLARLGIPGFRFALASDFLKEIGIKEFGKPDRWVYRCMIAAGWVTDEDTEADVQQVFWNLWTILGTDYPPVIVDKLMFLVGSGKFVMVEPAYFCRSRLEEFVKENISVRRSASHADFEIPDSPTSSTEHPTFHPVPSHPDPDPLPLTPDL